MRDICGHLGLRDFCLLEFFLEADGTTVARRCMELKSPDVQNCLLSESRPNRLAEWQGERCESLARSVTGEIGKRKDAFKNAGYGSV
jgi:hypothetical protein